MIDYGVGVSVMDVFELKKSTPISLTRSIDTRSHIDAIITGNDWLRRTNRPRITGDFNNAYHDTLTAPA
jgi:hypothetical protein